MPWYDDERDRRIAQKKDAVRAAVEARKLRTRSVTPAPAAPVAQQLAPADEAEAPPWVFSDKRQARIRDKLAAAAGSTRAGRLTTTKRAPVPGGVGLAIERTHTASDDESSLVAAFNRLAERAAAPACRRGFDDALARLRRHLGLRVDDWAHQLGVGPWAKRYPSAGDLLDRVAAVVGPAWHEFTGCTTPRLAAPPDSPRDGQLRALVFELPATLAPAASYGADDGARRVALDFTLVGTGLFRFAAALFHQLVLTQAAALDSDANPPNALGTLGPLDPALVAVWNVNLTEDYFSSGQARALFERQPIRVFERECAAWLRLRGWGPQA